MDIYHSFMRRILRDYLIGSMAAVLGIGAVFIFSSLGETLRQAQLLILFLLISLLVMVGAESFVLHRHLRPIRDLFRRDLPPPDMLESVYVHVHRFPILAVKRIFGPHLFGLSVPAFILLELGIQRGWLSFPHSYLTLASVGVPVVACMHAFIEFFLTSLSIRPVAVELRRRSLALHGIDLSLNGRVLMSVRRKFLFSAMLIGIFPLVLFILSGYIRQDMLGIRHSLDYWNWATVILVIGIAFSAFGAWVLASEIQHPIRTVTEAMARVQEGNFDIRAADIYSDEFSKVVAGFNHMVDGLKARETTNQQLVQSYFTTLAAALDARDPYTAGHSERVTGYAVLIGQAIGLPERELAVLRKAALLHDIGKIGVRDAVLLKEGKLTDEEFDLIKRHPELGERILKQIEPAEAMKDILPGVRSHHERYDGGGYPDGLAGEGIPLTGRIIAIADAFDAMTSDRPYRKGMLEEEALGRLEDGRGTQWDPRLAGVFIRLLSQEAHENGTAKTVESVEAG